MSRSQIIDGEGSLADENHNILITLINDVRELEADILRRLENGEFNGRDGSDGQQGPTGPATWNNCDRSLQNLAGAQVFSNLTVENGLVSAVQTRSL